MSDEPDALGILRDREASLTSVIQAVAALEMAAPSQHVRVGIAANVTADLLSLYLRRHALLSGVHLTVQPGSYDDPITDVQTFVEDGCDFILLLSLFDNLLPSFEAQVSTLSPEIGAAKRSEFRARIRLVFEQAVRCTTVFAALMHRMFPPATFSGSDPVALEISAYNDILVEEAASFGNVRLIDLGDVVAELGRPASFDLRHYFKSKAPYTPRFLDEAARRIAAASRNFGSEFKKVVLLDCDNTLWGGILGEDLIGGVKLDPHDFPGNVYWRVQHALVELQKSGALLGLCTKNNPEDVEELFAKHPRMALRMHHVIAKRVNWTDKASNIRDIAQELNVGLDSIIFVDDSPFECEAIRAQLPEVEVVQVPKAIAQYPAALNRLREAFLAPGSTGSGQAKTEQYRQRAAAEAAKARFDSQDEYLASLGLRIALARNETESIPRISELSRKSNQFNLTTRRYSEAEVRSLMDGNDSDVFSFSVSDVFGDAGLTGVVIMRYEGTTAIIDSFFMSCRVIGRGIEQAIWSPILAAAADRGCTVLRAEFRATTKNMQVREFYDGLGLAPVESTPELRQYQADLTDLKLPKTPWIEVMND